jgi:hypothetical protein
VLVKNPVPELFFVLMGTGLLLGAIVMLRGLPFVARTAVTLAILYLTCVAALLRVGYGPNPNLLLGLICFLGALLLGQRAGLVLVAVCTLTLAAIGYLHATHVVVRAENWIQTLDGAIAANALRIVVTFALVTTVIVTTVSYVLSRSEEVALAKERSLETVRREQAERERIARDLELSQGARARAARPARGHHGARFQQRLARDLGDARRARAFAHAAPRSPSVSRRPAYRRRSGFGDHEAAQGLRSHGPTPPERARPHAALREGQSDVHARLAAEHRARDRPPARRRRPGRRG